MTAKVAILTLMDNLKVVRESSARFLESNHKKRGSIVSEFRGFWSARLRNKTDLSIE